MALGLVVGALTVAGGATRAASEVPPPSGTMLVSTTRAEALHDEIWVVDVRTGARRSLSRHAAADREPAVSPDRTRVAFISDRGGAEAVWIRNAGGAALRRVAGPFGRSAAAVVRSLRWAPSGRALSFVVAPADDVRVVSLDGRQRVRLGRRAGFAEWSPDGSRLAVGEGLSSGAPWVAVYDLRGRRLARIPGAEAGWSSRGALAVGGARGTTSIATGAGRVVARVAGGGPSWSPDGRVLAVSDAKGLKLYSADGRLLLRKAGLRYPGDWSPDSRELLARDAREALVRLRTDGRLTTVGNVRTWVSWATWTPSGGLLALEPDRLALQEGGRLRRSKYVSPKGPCDGGVAPAGWVGRYQLVVSGGLAGRHPAGLWVVDPRTGRMRQFAGGPRWLVAPAWALDGSALAFVDGELVTHAGGCEGPAFPKLTFTRPDGSEAMVASEYEAEAEDRDHVWSPDARRVAVTHYSWETQAETVDVIAAATLARRSLAAGSSPSWAADGTTIVYSKGLEIRRVPVAGGRSTLIGRGSAPAASPEAPLVALIRSRALWTMSLDGGNARRLATLPPGASAPQWSPDGQRLAMSDPAGVTVVSRGSGRVTRITHRGAETIAWSPDARLIAFSAPVGLHSRTAGRWARSEVYVVAATGGRPRRVTHDLANVYGISWRP